MELTSVIFLYLLFGLFLAVFYLIINNIRQNRKIKKTFEEIKKLRKEFTQVSDLNKNMLKAIAQDDPALLEINFREETVKSAEKKQKPKKSFKERLNALGKKIISQDFDFETFSALKLLDKIGIVSFLIGIVYFVSLSMEMNWTNSFGRLFFGILLAGILLVAGYFTFRRFVQFSSVLLGGAVATLIFTLFAAFYQYHILGTWLSFFLIIILIASSVLISIAIKRPTIAILTFLAGFIAPFTVSVQGSDYLILFLYITILNIGVIAYDYFHKSLIINLISYIFTFLTYGIWLIKEFLSNSDIPLLAAFLFLTLFYIMIFIILIINNIRTNRKFIPLEFTGLVTATAIYYSAGIILINKTGMDYQGVFTAFISLIQYTYFLFLYPRKNYDRRILNLFLSLTIMFAALVVPVEYFGKSMTLVWAIQAVALLYIAMRSDLKPMYGGSFNLTLGAVLTLFYNLYDQYLSTTSFSEFRSFFNEGFIISLITVFALTLIIVLLKNSPHDYFYFKFLKVKTYQAILGVIAFVTFYFSVKFELQYYLMSTISDDNLIKTYLSIYNLSILLLIMLPSLFIKQKVINLVSFFAGIFMFLLFAFYYSGIFVNLRNSYLLSFVVSKKDFWVHYWSSGILLTASIIMMINALRLDFKQALVKQLLFGLSFFFFVFLLSSELTHIFVVKDYKPFLLIQNLVRKIHRLHYTVLWSFIALIFIVLGVFLDLKNFRTWAIILYIVTFVKIFVYDFKLLTSQDLTIVFSVLGLEMLISAFLLQYRLKKTKTANYDV